MSNSILDNIPMDLIDPNPDNSKIFTVDKIDHLANIIKEEGFTTPIEVVKKKDGRYEILSGHRRYAAMESLGRTEIPCYIAGEYDDTTDTEKMRRLLSSNITQRKLTPVEIANAIKFYRTVLKKEKYTGDKRKKIAKYFGISESNVYRYECILNLIPELQELCKRPNFPYSSLRQAASLTPADQKELYDELMRLESTKSKLLDASSNPSDKLNADDKSEIIFSRTRVETIINSKILKIKRENVKNSEPESKESVPTQDSIEEINENKEQSKNIADDFMPLPLEESYSDEESAIQEFLAKDNNNHHTVLLNLEEALQENVEDLTFFNGLDECIATVNAYRKSAAKSIRNSSEVREKIEELRNAIDSLEKILI